ncbi:MAG TPA: NADP-dependent oxidoreductase [Alphaproteobacteria bacterium]|nr:NADP-dependent oxidoreductase [Alphaproteobacteria bacterium]
MACLWTLAARPEGMPTLSDFALMEAPLPALEDGMIHVRNSWLSVDPYMRGRMNDAKSYAQPYEIGEPMAGGAVGTVVASRSPDYAVGDTVLHSWGWRDEVVAKAKSFTRLPKIDVPAQRFLGHLGMPGMTAYFGLLDVAAIKAAETLFVSAAAGAVGTAVVQIAKILGLTVIGSAGGAEKCALVRALGADAVIDHRTPGTMEEKLAAAAPEGIDVYFDNVGGDHLDAALAAAKDNARFAMCGMIETYNALDPIGLKNMMRIVRARIRMQGFIIFDYNHRIDEFHSQMGKWIAEGRIRSEETVRDGLAAMPQAFLDLFAGGNTGKMLIRL